LRRFLSNSLYIRSKQGKNKKQKHLFYSNIMVYYSPVL
jgi:hypothetical protein